MGNYKLNLQVVRIDQVAAVCWTEVFHLQELRHILGWKKPTPVTAPNEDLFIIGIPEPMQCKYKKYPFVFEFWVGESTQNSYTP